MAFPTIEKELYLHLLFENKKSKILCIRNINATNGAHI